jgi:hypothetical protein
VLVALYLTAVCAYLVALGPAAATASDAIAATAIRAVLGLWAGKIVALTILISTFSSTNSILLTAPRVFYAMATTISSSRNSPKSTPASRLLPLPLSRSASGPASSPPPENSPSSSAESSSSAGFSTGSALPPFFVAAGPSRGRRASDSVSRTRLPGDSDPLRTHRRRHRRQPVLLAFRDPHQFRHLIVAIILFALGIPAYYLWPAARAPSHPV